MRADTASVHRSLHLFGTCFTGREFRVEPVDSVLRTWPWTLTLPDPDTVAVMQLGPTPDHAQRDEATRAAVRAQVLHHGALSEFGTFGADPAVPDPDAARHHPAVVSSPQRALASGLVAVLEHHRIGVAAMRRFPGARRDTDALLRRARLALVGSGARLGLVGAVAIRTLGGSTDEMASAVRLDRDLLVWLADRVDELGADGATLEDSARLAARLAALVGRAEPPVETHVDQELVPDIEAVTGDHLADEVGYDLADEVGHDLADEVGRDLADEGTMMPSPGDGEVDMAPGDVEVDMAPGGADGQAMPGALSLAGELEQVQELTAPATETLPSWSAPRRPRGPSYLYDEWDMHRRCYRPAWCRVSERRPAGADADFIDDVRKRNADLARSIRRQFALLEPDRRRRVHRRLDGEELDLDAIIESRVDRRCGVAPDDRLHLRREPAVRDVAAAFLLDLSASTSAPLVEPEPVVLTEAQEQELLDDPFGSSDLWNVDEEPRRRVIDVVKDAAVLMCDALEQLGDQHAVYGFSGEGRDGVEFHVGKDFDEPSSASVWAALASFEPIRYTRMGPAVRHSVRKLSAVEAQRRLLIIVSDGYPQDRDYGPDRNDTSYGVHDTARAVDEAGAVGVDVFCVTIDPTGNDYLQLMFEESRYLVIDDVETLPAQLAKLYLGAAGARGGPDAGLGGGEPVVG